MIRIRRGVVRSVRARRPSLLDVRVQLDDGSLELAIAYPDLCGPVAPGDRVVLNTTALALGLGTGGVHFVIAVEGGPDADSPDGARAMKNRYTPLQAAVTAIEETPLAPTPSSLQKTPVVAAGLHSAVAPVAIGVHATRPGTRVVLVHTDAGALPVAFSDAVAALRGHGLIAATVASGQSFGGDVEAVNVYSGMLAARHILGGEIVVVAMGPGNLGTGSEYGFASMEVADIVNAVAALDGVPIVVPRIGFADPRPRHHGVSHHTITALGATLAPATIPLPSLEPDRAEIVRAAIRPLAGRHTIVEVELGEAEAILKSPPVPLSTMGRSFDDEPDYFRTAAAAGVLATSMLS